MNESIKQQYQFDMDDNFNIIQASDACQKYCINQVKRKRSVLLNFSVQLKQT